MRDQSFERDKTKDTRFIVYKVRLNTGDSIVEFKTMFELIVDILSGSSHRSKTNTEAATVTDYIGRGIT